MSTLEMFKCMTASCPVIVVNLKAFIGEIDRGQLVLAGTAARVTRIAHLTVEVDVCDRARAESGQIALAAFELSQTLNEKWLTADYRAKRKMLEIVSLNFRLIDATLVPEWRKPFDALAEGLNSEDSRSKWTAVERFLLGSGSVASPSVLKSLLVGLV